MKSVRLEMTENCFKNKTDRLNILMLIMDYKLKSKRNVKLKFA